MFIETIQDTKIQNHVLNCHAEVCYKCNHYYYRYFEPEKDKLIRRFSTFYQCVFCNRTVTVPGKLQHFKSKRCKLYQAYHKKKLLSNNPHCKPCY